MALQADDDQQQQKVPSRADQSTTDVPKLRLCLGNGAVRDIMLAVWADMRRILNRAARKQRPKEYILAIRE